MKLLQTTETGNCFYSECLDNFMQYSLLREVDSADDDKKERTFVKQTQVLKESLLYRVKIYFNSVEKLQYLSHKLGR